MLEPTTEEFHQSVCKSINTNLEQLQQDVELLKQWLSSQPHLPQCSSDTMLRAYLIACKNRMERVKEKIEKYYTARAQIRDIFADRDPLDERIKECGEEIELFTLPKLTPDGCRVTMTSIVTGDPKKYDVLAFSKRSLSLEDIKLNQEAFNKGLYYVIDSSNFSMAHIFRINPIVVHHLIQCCQDALPLKIKGVIFFNAPTYLDIVLAIIKPFIKAKVFQRFHVHTEGPEVLEKYFPRAMLPKNYGGDEDTSKNLNEAWMKYLISHRDWLMSDGVLTADMGKKTKNKSEKNKKSTNVDVENSFKSLSID